MIKVSFLIPALNEEKNIQNCLRAIYDNCSLNPAEYEIIVADHGSSDKTAYFSTSLGATVIHQQGGTIASLRNHLVRVCSGKILVFIDADVCVTESWGRAFGPACISLCESPRQITGSRCSPPSDYNFIISNWFGVMPTAKSSYLGTGHIIFTRDVFDEIGGFDEKLKTGEDYDFCMRARSLNIVININAALKVIHYDYPSTIRDFVRRERWHGSGDFQSWRNIAASRVAQLTIFFMACHVEFLLSLFFGRIPTIATLIFLFVFLMAASFSKFSKLDGMTRLKNIFLMYCYFLGRSLSFFSRIPFFLNRNLPPNGGHW